MSAAVSIPAPRKIQSAPAAPAPAPAQPAPPLAPPLAPAPTIAAQTVEKASAKPLSVPLRLLVTLAVGASAWLLTHAFQARELITTFSFRAPLLQLASLAPAAFRTKLIRAAVASTHRPAVWPLLTGLAAGAAAAFLAAPRRAVAIALRIGSYTWTVNDACRGWLITGATGSGKTAAAIVYMIHGFCQAMPRTPARIPWGGVCFDEKALFYQTFVPILEHYGRGSDVVLVQVRMRQGDQVNEPGDPDLSEGQDLAALTPHSPKWKPRVRINLLYADSILAATMANLLCDSAGAVQGGKGSSSNPVFPETAKLAMTYAIELCRAIAAREAELHDMPLIDRFVPKITRIYEMLSSVKVFDAYMVERGVVVKGQGMQAAAKGKEPRPEFHPGPLLQDDTKAAQRLQRFYREIQSTYFDLPNDTFGGVKANILTYLAPYIEEDIAEVFSADTTFTLDQLDAGKILFLAMPQRFRVQRRYISAILTTIVMQQALARFDLLPVQREKLPPLFIWMDEAQRYATDEIGNADVLREAKCGIIVATQMGPSLWKPLGGRETAGVVTDNLRNRWVFQSACHDCAEASARFLGQHRKKKRSYSSGRGGKSTTTNTEIAYRVEPCDLRALNKYNAYLVHAEGKWRKMVVPCLDQHGRPHSWWFSDIAFRHPIVWITQQVRALMNGLRRNYKAKAL